MKDFKIYFKKRFYKDKKGYWINSMPIHAQRWVWINHYGTIPDGMDIHHIDGDKSNNEIENLEMISRSEHLKKHWKEGRFDLEQRKEQLKEARKWLQTPQGKSIQADNTKKSWNERKLNPYNKKCLGCENNFESYQKWAKYCSAKCLQRYRRKNKIGFIDKKCWICGNIFFNDKFSRVRTCGKECGVKLQLLNTSQP
jgi:hypothetical protein